MTTKMNEKYFEIFCTFKECWRHISTKTKQNSNTETMRCQLPQHFV